MCGIFGMVVRGSRADRSSVERDLNTLFRLTEPRGRQAAGVGLYRDDVINVFKQPETASKMITRPSYRRFLDASFEQGSTRENSVAAFVGHCRLVTDGTELNPRNNHPFVVDNLVGVHNGVVTNHRVLMRLRKMAREGDTDTEVLFGMLANASREHSDPRNAVSETYGELIGSAAIGVLNTQLDVLCVATNFGSLYYTWSEEEQFFAFASEGGILRNFLAQTERSTSAPVAPLTPSTGAIVRFDSVEPVFFPLQRKHLSVTEKAASQPELSPQGDVEWSGYQRGAPAVIVSRVPSPDSLKRCTRCILPENYPFLTFDEHGVCSHCTKYLKQRFHGKEALARFFDKYRSKNGDPDCLV